MIQPTSFTKYEGLAIQEICVHGIRTIIGNRTTKEFINEQNHDIYFLIGIRGRGKSPSGKQDFINTIDLTNYWIIGLYIIKHDVSHYYFGSTNAGYYKIILEYIENPWIIQPVHSQMPALGRRNRKLIKKTIREYLKTIGDQTCQTAAT